MSHFKNHVEVHIGQLTIFVHGSHSRAQKQNIIYNIIPFLIVHIIHFCEQSINIFSWYLLFQTNVTFQSLMSALIWFTGFFVQYKAIQTKIDFKSCLIHYLDHVWLLDPVSPYTYSSVSPFTSAFCDRRAFFLLFVLSWDSKLSRLKSRINHSERCRTSFFPLTLLSSPFSLFQESLVDFWFQKSWITVVFHQPIYQSLCPVEAIWPRLRDIFTDFFSRHTVNVYLSRRINLDKLYKDSFGSNHHFCVTGLFLVVLTGQPKQKVLLAVFCL